MRNDEQREAEALVDLGEVAIVTKGSALGVPDLGAGQKIPFEGLSND